MCFPQWTREELRLLTVKINAEQVVDAVMRIHCWGARGSIAVSGPEYRKYGGDSTCLEVRDQDGRVVVVDCGTGVRPLGNAIVQSDVREIHMLFTHLHWDHIIGFPFFKPLYISKYDIHVYGCKDIQGKLLENVYHTMSSPHFPIEPEIIRAEVIYHDLGCSDFEIGNLRITPIALRHPNHGLGFKFREGGMTFVFLTDNELSHPHEGGQEYEDYVQFCKGADVLIHDAEYQDGEYEKTRGWGHSRARDAVRLALDAGVASLGLFHHNQDRTDAQVDEMVEMCRKLITDAGGSTKCFGVRQGMQIVLE